MSDNDYDGDDIGDEDSFTDEVEIISDFAEDFVD